MNNEYFFLTNGFFVEGVSVVVLVRTYARAKFKEKGRRGGLFAI